MRKNRREIILDFTSLLDVIMILLFFFVIFAQIDSNRNIAEAKEAAAAEIAAVRKEAEEEKAAAAEAAERAEKELEEIRQVSDRAAANIRGLVDFNSGVNLKLYLSGEKENWQIKVMYGGEDTEIIGDVRNRSPEELAGELTDMISRYGYTEDSAVLCDLFYNSLDTGSRKAKENADRMLELVREDYPHLFCSRTDMSKLEE